VKAKRIGIGIAILWLMAALPRAGAAQMISLGETISSPLTAGGPSALAYDDKREIYLHVWGEASALEGQFVRFDGTRVGSVFEIAHTSINSSIVEPRVAYSSGSSDDLFVVT
jgi:hypothetical protein